MDYIQLCHFKILPMLPIAAHITAEISGLTQVCHSYCASINTDLAIDLDRFFSPVLIVLKWQ